MGFGAMLWRVLHDAFLSPDAAREVYDYAHCHSFQSTWRGDKRWAKVLL
jgi:hypothetical protein